MRDIATREDLFFLMRAFYTKLFADKEIGYIFTDLAKIDLEEHLPSLTDFWENMLIAPNGYQKNVMEIHFNLNKKEKLLPIHFQKWMQLFSDTIDENYKGEKAEDMKSRAHSIAGVMQFKLENIK